MANAKLIQECIDSCIQSANTLRSAANTLLYAMERQTVTAGAAHIEMCINACVQVKNSLS
jgi:hypothetical protein